MNVYEITNERDVCAKRVEYLKTIRHELCVNNYRGMTVDDAISIMDDEIKSSAKHVRNINNLLEDKELIGMVCD